MKKTLLATSIALSLSIASPSTNAAFTALSAGDYTMSITGGCFSFGNCQTNGSGAFTDNAASVASFTTTADTLTTRSVGSTIGSGIAGDGLMGVINFSVDASGSMAIRSFNQDTYRSNITPFGNFYIDAFGTGGISAMMGNIGTDGAMTFTPTGREAMMAAFATGIGVQEWNRDSLSGFYDTLTTGTSTNRTKDPISSFTLTGTALSDNGMGGWTGTLVTAGNFSDNWGGFGGNLYSEVWSVSIAATVPVPAAAWLFGSGLLGLIGIARRKKV